MAVSNNNLKFASRLHTSAGCKPPGVFGAQVSIYPQVEQQENKNYLGTHVAVTVRHLAMLHHSVMCQAETSTLPITVY